VPRSPPLKHTTAFKRKERRIAFFSLRLVELRVCFYVYVQHFFIFHVSFEYVRLLVLLLAEGRQSSP